jgi:hypothetical protein
MFSRFLIGGDEWTPLPPFFFLKRKCQSRKQVFLQCVTMFSTSLNISIWIFKLLATQVFILTSQSTALANFEVFAARVGSNIILEPQPEHLFHPKSKQTSFPASVNRSSHLSIPSHQTWGWKPNPNHVHRHDSPICLAHQAPATPLSHTI